MRCFIYKNKDYNILDLLSILEGNSNLPLFIDQDFDVYSDILLEDLDITELQKLKFQENNIYTLRQFNSKTEEEILSIDRIGIKIFEKLKDISEDISYEKLEVEWDEDFSRIREAIIAAENLKMPLLSIVEIIYANLDLFKEDIESIGDLKRLKGIDEAIRNLILDYLQSRELTTVNNIYMYINLKSFDRNYIKSQLKVLLDEDKIYKDGDYYFYKHITIKDYLAKCENGRELEFFLDHVSGNTLQEIGKKNGLTRERVRQIIKNFTESLPEFYEDRYEYIISKYNISKKAFKKLLNEDEFVYDYVVYTFGLGKKPIEEALDDIELPDKLKVKIEDYLSKEHIFLDGIRIYPNENSVIAYLLYKFFKEKRNIEELAILYDAFLNRHGIELEMVDNLKNFAAKIERRLDVLYSQGRQVRYYPIEGVDFEKLKDILNSEQYQDLEFSTLKIFRSNLELMEEYGILDEYELHNLLRKIVDDENIEFGRMPMLSIGNGDRQKQIMDLLVERAPITPEDLAAAYEERYGARNKSILAYYFNDLSKYLHDGIYYIDLPEFTQREKILMKHLLVEDFYTIDEVRKLYCKATGNCKSYEKINHTNMVELGYLVFSSYMIKEEFKSGVEYVRSILSDSYIDLNKINRDLKNLPMFQSELYNQRYEYQIVEYQEGKFINIAELEQMDIHKIDLRRFANSVYNFVGDEVFNIYNLRSRGFSNFILKGDFEDFFYGSILSSDERFASRRLDSCRIFKKDDDKIVVNDLIKDILIENGPMELEKLKAYMRDIYKIRLDTFRLKLNLGDELEYIEDGDLLYLKTDFE